MYRYVCHICGCNCDAGELVNGVCDDCRDAAVKAEENRQLRIRMELNQAIRARYAQQPDGQMVMCYGK